MNLWHSLLVIFIFIGCSEKNKTVKQKTKNANMKKISIKSIEGFKTDNLNYALKVFKKDCKSTNIDKSLRKICNISKNYKNGYDFFTKYFYSYRLLDKDNNDNGLITGYYEPLLNGNMKKTSKFKYPIYTTPKDLVTIDMSLAYPELKKYILRGKIVGNKVVPYDTRSQYKLKKHNDNILCYVDNKIDRFFLEIQGSGKVKLQNGKILNIGYLEQNGHKYYPVGKTLIKNGSIKKEDMSLQAIRKWCNENPKKVDKLLNQNKSQIFFKITKQTATGSLGVPLVAKRNIAVDRRYIPFGYPVFINTTHPITHKKINTLTIAADTGGAIKGKIRADLFWGFGNDAELNAGKMARKGKLTIFIPKKQIIK